MTRGKENRYITVSLKKVTPSSTKNSNIKNKSQVKREIKSSKKSTERLPQQNNNIVLFKQEKSQEKQKT